MNPAPAILSSCHSFCVYVSSIFAPFYPLSASLFCLGFNKNKRYRAADRDYRARRDENNRRNVYGIGILVLLDSRFDGGEFRRVRYFRFAVCGKIAVSFLRRGIVLLSLFVIVLVDLVGKRRDKRVNLARFVYVDLFFERRDLVRFGNLALYAVVKPVVLRLCLFEREFRFLDIARVYRFGKGFELRVGKRRLVSPDRRGCGRDRCGVRYALFARFRKRAVCFFASPMSVFAVS